MTASETWQPTMPRMPRWQVIALAVLAQLLLLASTFNRLLFHPGDYIIVDHYDGVKSYFSIASFLQQPLGDGMLLHGHNYPFGEYMYYTDSTPLVVAPLHWLVQTVPALAPYGLYIYDLFVLSSIVISSALLVLILRRLAVPTALTLLLAVALPWLGPQTVRLNVGHMSLAYTPAILFGILALQKLYDAWRADAALWKPFSLLLFGIVVTSWLHFYYLPLLGGSLAFFAIVLLAERPLRRRWRELIVCTGVTLLSSLVLTAGLLMLLDPLQGQRETRSGGYDWIEWKFQFGALFQGYVFTKIRFPFERTAVAPYESAAYLTGFVLFGLLVVAVLLAVRRLPAGARLPRLAADDNARFLLYLLLASLPLAFIALGENIELDGGAYVIHNYLNVFRWLHKVTDRVTQFRALGRFIWPFWWAVVLGFSWYVARWWRLGGLRWVLLALCVILVVDTLNARHFYHTVPQKDNLFAFGPRSEPVRQLLQQVDSHRYQALLPLPYYHSGTDAREGVINLIVDPDDPHCNVTYQLSIFSNLPLMSHKATRAITEQAQALYSMFRPGGPDPAFLARLDTRPILVFLDTAYYDGRNNYYRDLLKPEERPEMRAIFERGPDFIREQQMRRLAHQGSWSLYEWQPRH
ncbi:hypothetical protein Q5H93_10045 [Hymenobacter sp. ASUV-10]|uniref:DUF6311 domain-containing protein n=1 Tax=Hymenobacter aranciens TaxID=3063996 RepID=A0ABT9B9Y4_9BACT|nr:hypothetical protein [Hymenobacter sp. ASUV-10]MDO7875071.1 hypothetical protein [Hymenobacter sp. ASUV-10]